MDMSNFRPESHVAQQSRRDKLRVVQNSHPTTQHLEDYTSNLDVRYTNSSYDMSIFSSEMLNFATNSQLLSASAKLDRHLMADNGLCANSSNFNPSSKSMNVDPQNCSNWRSIGSQQSCDWSTGNYSNGYQEEMPIKSLPLYQNNLQEYFVTTAPPNVTGGLEMESPVQRSVGGTSIGSWRDHGNELLFIPTYGDQSHSLCPDNSYPQMNKNDSNTQGLSLSLSSVPMAKTHVGQFGDRNDSDQVQSRNVVFNNLHDSKKLNSGCLDVHCEQSMGRNTGQDLVGTRNFSHRISGPLGPFTGYATILKNSKFLKPTQQLLDEFCTVNGQKLGEACDASDKISKGGNSGTSSSTFRMSNEISGEGGVGRSSSESFQLEYQTKNEKLLYMHEEVGRSSSESFQLEYQTKNEKLLYMHEEVFKRYKQYHQQIQMVVSSFESVAGLSSATPNVGLALKAVSRHFRCLKNAISEQLGRIRDALGEDLSSPTTGTSSCKGDTSSMSRLNFVDHSFQKHKFDGSSGGANVGFFEHQKHVWRPQRGLPDRAVAVLRAWLFDHFLHPYPTDTDKHMLASQTGLSRNQVSNWFINARVRVWKPMVEEIHHLETKSLAEPDSIPSKVDGKPLSRSPNRTDDDQTINRLSIQGMSNNQVECSRDGQIAELWNQEKRSRTEFEIPASTDLSGFVPFQRGGFEIGVGSAVSLTLGLRQSAESAQQREQENRLRRHFGSQMMIHDFVG